MSSVIFHHPSEITPWLQSVISSNREYQLFHVAQIFSASAANSFYICRVWCVWPVVISLRIVGCRQKLSCIFVCSTLKSHLKSHSGEESNIFQLSICQYLEVHSGENYHYVNGRYVCYQYVNDNFDHDIEFQVLRWEVLSSRLSCPGPEESLLPSLDSSKQNQRKSLQLNIK